ncbi:MAG: sigma-54 dependent transcriptional regulator [Bacteroidota bacterium]|nr:sigma-54 dependent transcriptional regulator [Bacteroidota bacterium]
MENNEAIKNLLIIDDDPFYRKLSASILNDKFNIFTAEKPSDAFKILKNENISYIIVDYLLPEMTGLQILDKVKKKYPDIEVIMISESGNMDTVIGALREGAADFFKKPFTPSDIWMAIERIKYYRKIKNELEKQKNTNIVLKDEISKYVGNIIGKSKEIVEIREEIKLVAQTPDTSVLIIGESGTGKELVAREIHEKSSRKNNMFGAVNMSAIPDTLFESEFFGHKKGSFTDAISDKAGWFESTNKGTLFLDEIGEMSLGLQVKLLRVLEDRTYTIVGTQKANPFDVRIVAATNKRKEELTDGKNFRLDLFYRLGTFIIHLPPLREIKEDIPILAEHFLKMFNDKMGKSINKISPKVIDLFNAYDFPGNIRELKNIIERAVIVCKSDQLMVEHFNLISTSNRKRKKEETFDLIELEKNTIIRALEKTNYNKAEAAKLLNLKWNALFRRIKKYKIDLNQ